MSGGASGGLIRGVLSFVPIFQCVRTTEFGKRQTAQKLLLSSAFALQVAYPRLAIVLSWYRIIVWHCVLLNRDSSHDYKQHIGERSCEPLRRNHKLQTNVLKSLWSRKFPRLLRFTNQRLLKNCEICEWKNLRTRRLDNQITNLILECYK